MTFGNTAGAILVLALAALPANAANVTQVQQKLDVAAAPADVWAKIGAFCAIGTWHPALAKCDEVKDGDVVRRTLTLKDGGGEIKEKLTGSSDTGYTYIIEESPLPVKDYSASFSVREKPDAAGTSTIVWTSNFTPNGKTEAEAKTIIQGVFEAGLNSIKDSMAAK